MTPASATAASEQAKARAAQAEIDAQRHADKIEVHAADAEEQRRAQQETLRKADDIDPYVDTNRTERDRADEPAPTRRTDTA